MRKPVLRVQIHCARTRAAITRHADKWEHNTMHGLLTDNT